MKKQSYNDDDDWGEIFEDDKAIVPIQNSTPLTANSTDRDLFGDEMVALEQTLGYLRAAWPMARTVDQVCKIALTVGKTLETRRSLFERTKKSGLDNNDIIDMFTEDDDDA